MITMDGEISNTPKNLVDFAGQFVVFFSEDEDPKVLFSTPISEAAYKKAEELAQAENRKPVVMRIQENPQNNIAQIIATRAHA
jgi:hypothetical protein